MKNVSSAFREELKKDNRNYIKSADIALKNGTVLEIDNSDLWQNGMKLDTATSSSNSFDLGAIITGQLTLTLNNIDEKFSDYDFTDCTATNVKVGLKLPDGTTESLSYGKFYLNEAKYNGSIITLTFYDSIYKFDRPYSKSSLSYPATLRQIVQDACSVCGVTLVTATFDQDDFVVQERPDDSSITFRQVLQWVGQIACYYFYADSQGRLSMKWYDLSAFEDADNIFLEDSDGNFVLDVQEDKIFTFVENGTIYPGTTMPHHNLASFVSLNTGLDDVVITGIKVIQEVDGESGGKEEISYQSGNDGYVLAVSKNKLIQGDSGNTIASLLGTKIIGMRFRTFSASGLSDPTIEAGDPVVLIDRKGKSYQSYITNNVFQPGAYQSTSLGAETPARKSATRYSQISQVYVDYRKEIQKERTEREKALEELGERLEASTGVFTTIEEQPDGSKIYYLHNKPSLDDSDIVWKMTAEAWGVSTDGGKTWNAGMTVDGDTIVRILTATGVNADWIKTGALQISDTDGNIIFLADMDTKQLIISGDYISIGDQSATDLINQANKNANEALEEVKKAKGFNVILSNEYAGISVDNDGNYTKFPETKTVAYAFMGSQDITDECSFSVQKSAGVTGSWSANTHTYTVTGLSTDSGWVDITATYMTILTAVKRFNLSKIKGGKPGTPGDPGTPGRTYYIQPSRTALKQTESHSISPGYIDFNAYYRDGTNASRVAYSGRFKIEEQSSVGTWTTIYTSAANETSVRHILYYVLQDTDGNFIGDADGYAFGGWRDIAQIRVSLYAAGGTTQLINQQTIPVVKDGEKGEDGTALTPDEVFNILTNNGKIQGLYKIGDKIYFNAEYIKSGTIIADLIKGGILNLGGVSNENGVLVMRNASGQEIGRWDKDGLVVKSGAISANAISGGALDLGGASNGNGILRIFNASGTQVGYINNTGVHFSQGEVSANVIKGGTLKLGGSGNGNGLLQIYNASGKSIGHISNTGVYFDQGQIVADVIKGGTLTLGGASNGNGILRIFNASGAQVGYIDNTGVHFNKGTFSGSITVGGDSSGIINIKNSNNVTIGTISESGVILNGSSVNPYFIVNSSSGNTKVSISGSGVRCFNGTSSYITMEGGTIPYLSILDSNGNSTSVRGTSISTDGSLSIGGISSFGGYATFEQSIIANSSITCKGTLTVSGYKNRLVETDNYDERLLYSYEMPSPMFGDIGEATTDENGECYLFLDDIFQETVTTSIEYQVFLQKEGQGDIWVKEKTEQYFVVKGTPNLKFAWEIKAKQREYEYERLETYGSSPEIRELDYEEEANKYVDEIIHDYENSTFDAIKYYEELEEAA